MVTAWEEEVEKVSDEEVAEGEEHLAERWVDEMVWREHDRKQRRVPICRPGVRTAV